MAGTTKDKIQKALETKQAIFEAIRSKGVLVPNPSLFSSYPDSIKAIKLDTLDGAFSSKIVQKTLLTFDFYNEEGFTSSFSSQIITG